MCDCKWRDIESAPRDRLILIAGGTWEGGDYRDMPQHCAAIAYWYQDHWRGNDLPSHDEWMHHEPTHWQPLPAAPQPAGEGE